MHDRNYECHCGHAYKISEKDGSILRCPSCGRIVAFPSKEMDPARREEFEKFMEATFEIMEEGVEGGCPFSGAR
ncbi:MAG: hypothetical protein WAL98_06170 [Desulfatiglandaceae bacterium]|jgi:DNA-directed RNA polymerase subunit RPC12/RpoP